MSQASDLLGADNIVTSYPLGVAMLHVFSHKDTPAVTSWKELRGKTIGGTLGFEPYYTNLIDRGFSISYVGNEEKLTLMLEKGRFDVMLGFLPDHFPNLDRLNYSPDFVLSAKSLISSPAIIRLKGGCLLRKSLRR